MLINLIRLLLVVICVGLGRYIGPEFGLSLSEYGGIIAGGIIAVGIILLEKAFKKASLKELSVATSGFVMGLVAANLLSIPFYLIPIGDMKRFIVPLGLNIMLGYMGVIMSLERKADFTILPFLRNRTGKNSDMKVIDTSVIIDGRIVDISRTGFLGGSLVVPRFVLHELHTIADCPDSLKRKRGRRGLEILNKMQKDPKLNVTIEDMDFPEVDGVDSKLIKFGKIMNVPILTNDYNLNRVAELENVRVLNINELANAMKPVVLPGEVMNVKVVKEGKEHNQGIGYLEDGTMIVIENGKKSTGLTVDVIVTSVLQTSAGKMIFGRLRGMNE